MPQTGAGDATSVPERMSPVRDEPRSGCPINAGLEALGDPWALLVLRDIVFGNRRHFRELLTGSDEGIASNILSNRLKRLVAAGLLTREPGQRGRRAPYTLTEAGIETVPIMVALGSWGLANRPGSPELRIRAELLRDGGPPLWEDFMDELREVHLGVPRRHPDRPSVSEQLERAYRKRGSE